MGRSGAVCARTSLSMELGTCSNEKGCDQDAGIASRTSKLNGAKAKPRSLDH